MHHATDKSWLEAECVKADSFAELVPLALAELKKFPTGAETVCGPISTGGRGSIEENFRVFGATITALTEQGRPIFSQVPYEERIFFFRKRWQDEGPSRAGAYYMPILEEFYHPLLTSGLIRRAWFIPGWESSYGARWERDELTKAGAEIVDLTDEQVDEFLSSER
ncbi:MAG TPA: hypothetical protein VF696_01580 [Candidatus Paceibacterota bacterium]|jgi:hypothetical protein